MGESECLKIYREPQLEGTNPGRKEKKKERVEIRKMSKKVPGEAYGPLLLPMYIDYRIMDSKRRLIRKASMLYMF